MIKPLNDCVVLKKETISNNEEKVNGIYFASKKEVPDNIAIVVNVAQDVTNIAIKDKVLYEEYKGTKVKLDEVEYIIIKSKDILGIVLPNRGE